MPTKDDHPLSGMPRTVERRDAQGNVYFILNVAAQTPVRRIAADGGSLLLACGYGLYCLLQAPPHLVNWAVAAALTYGGFWALRFLGRQALKQSTEIRMSADRISVQRWHGWSHYDRRIERSFAGIRHDWAQWEAEREAHRDRKASSKGQLYRPKYVFGHSFHVALIHAGQRRDLVTVFGQKAAAGVIARLQYCDRRLNAATGTTGGVHERPGDEWSEAPGGLDDE